MVDNIGFNTARLRGLQDYINSRFLHLIYRHMQGLKPHRLHPITFPSLPHSLTLSLFIRPVTHPKK